MNGRISELAQTNAAPSNFSFSKNVPPAPLNVYQVPTVPGVQS